MRVPIFLITLFIMPTTGWADSARHTLPSHLPECPATHVTDALVASDGTLWVASESQGVYRLPPTNGYAGPWMAENRYQGFPEHTANFYCIAEDLQKRIWVGSDNQGAAVFNGETWTVFNRENALLGERVFDIAVSPVTGDVALATSGSLGVYQPGTDSWISLTRTQGLAENQVQSLAYQQDGALWIAYACGGISKVLPQKNYTVVQTFQAPWQWDRNGFVRQPPEGMGKGLPSNLCNAVIAGRKGTIWLGTNCGLAYSEGGRNWEFIRGRDFKDKNEGVYGFSKKNAVEPTPGQKKLLLPEDYITSLVEAESGDGVWIGTREQGVCLWSPEKGVAERLQMPRRMQGWPVTALAVFPDGTLAAGSFGGGVSVLKKGSGTWTSPEPEASEFPPFPSPIRTEAPSFPEIPASRKNHSPALQALYYKEDWTTKGDWCGAYGNISATLCAANAPFDDCTYTSRFAFGKKKKRINEMMSMFLLEYSDSPFIGMHNRQDTLRSWVHWVTANENRNVLYCPTDAVRTEAEWDDHGEAYPAAFDGPDIWLRIKIPDGLHSLDLYFFNPNGRENRSTARRDYVIEIKKRELAFEGVSGCELSTKSQQMEYERFVAGLYGLPVLARARVSQFSGSGVYKTFLLNGKGTYWVKIARNNSFNTIVNGVFISKMRAPADIDRKMLEWGLSSAFYYVCPLPPDVDPAGMDAQSLQFYEKWNTFVSPLLSDRTSADRFHTALLRQYRHLSATDAAPSLRSRLKWELRLVNPQDRQQFDKTMAKSWQTKQDTEPAYRSKEFMPHGPGTVPFSISELEQMEKMHIDWRQYRDDAPSPPAKSVEEMKQFLKSHSNQ